MAKIDSFINLYPVSKTLRFRAIPVGKTQENMEKKSILEADNERAAEFSKAKDIITRYHKTFADRILPTIKLEDIYDYSELFHKKEKIDEEKKAMSLMEESMRQTISDAFTSDPEYKKLFGKELIRDILPAWLKDEDEKTTIAKFYNFTTAFAGFNQIRESLYSAEEKKSSIAFRSINENLPMFLSNQACFQKIQDALGEDTLEELNRELDLGIYDVSYCFSDEYFHNCLTEKGIDWYNMILGGKTTEDRKIKGLNEYINLYNQQNKTKLPRLKPLYKQLLSDKESFSIYNVSAYEKDEDVLSDIAETAGSGSDIYKALSRLKSLFEDFTSYNLDGIYVDNTRPSGKAAITAISHSVLGNNSMIERAWNERYDSENLRKPPKDIEKYESKRSAAYKKEPSFSLEMLQSFINAAETGGEKGNICSYYKENVLSLIRKALQDHSDLDELIKAGVPNGRKLQKDDNSISIIKAYLDDLKDIKKLVFPLTGTGKEEKRDEVFYGEFIPALNGLRNIDGLYNAVRNYITRKPYSKDKFKLYFGNPLFMSGWSRTKLDACGATLARRNGEYFLIVLDNENRKALYGLKESNNTDGYEILNYMLLPGPNKMLPKVFLSNKGLDEYNASDDIRKIAKEKSFTKSSPYYSIENCHKMIDYFKSCLKNHYWQGLYDFKFSDTASYADISGFYREVEAQGYRFDFTKADASEFDKLVDEGSIYLFRIWCKDFSSYSKGKKNLHTLYFESLFNPEAGAKLCGGAELFLRNKSIDRKDRIIHQANKAIKNKNPLNPKKESVFGYDIIKDRRYTEDQYEFHVPVTLNRTADGNTYINDMVRKELKDDPNPHVIGINRGERNLIYVCVIDGKGNIVEQASLNEIIDDNIRTDYRLLLDNKEQARMQARKDWKTIEGIKELKSGYISQIIHKITVLMEKYDAVVALEDLNGDFKSSRANIEKNVYQKFEKALMDKLCYLVDKEKEAGTNGSEAKGYQLCRPVTALSDVGYQNGFVFFVPPYYTSTIDPVTGFIPTVYLKYTNMEKAREFIHTFDAIVYDPDKDMFRIGVDLDRFEKTGLSPIRKWDVYTNADRIKVFRNPEINSKWDSEKIVLTEALKNLFDNYSIDWKDGDLRDKICEITEKKFYEELFGLLRLTFQMKNMAPNDTDPENDYLISPVMDRNGRLFDSREAGRTMPVDTGANGAYNIARKALLSIRKLKEAPDAELSKCKIGIKNAEWMAYMQRSNWSITPPKCPAL